MKEQCKSARVNCELLMHSLSMSFPFAGAGYDSIIPDAPNAESHQLTKTLAENVGKLVEQYIDAMEKVSRYFWPSIYLFLFIHTVV